jgi:metal-sulfur cluster biosynthetic enzyme
MAFTQDFLLMQLSRVIDPEVGLNIVEMGLVYFVEEKGGVVRVEMTLTTPGCPMSSYMTQEVKAVLGQLSGIRDVEVEIVWSPPWSPDKIQPEALERLHQQR